MLSKSSRNAIRAVLYLSLNSDKEKKYSPKKIAQAIGISAPFLAKTLQELTKRNLISSTRGRHGGFYLTENNRQNALISIVDAIDGLDRFQDCQLGLSICSDSNPCPIHDVISPLRKRIIEEFTFKTIEDLTLEINQGKTYII